MKFDKMKIFDYAGLVLIQGYVQNVINKLDLPMYFTGSILQSETYTRHKMYLYMRNSRVVKEEESYQCNACFPKTRAFLCIYTLVRNYIIV